MKLVRALVGAAACVAAFATQSAARADGMIAGVFGAARTCVPDVERLCSGRIKISPLSGG